MNKIILYGLFIIGTICSSIFYTLASYYFRLGESRNIKFMYIYIISIILGICSYLIKVPVFYFLGKKMNVMIINITFLVITFILVTLFSKFVLKENIPTHTYLIIILIILLIILNNILDCRK
jgi:uncharacterized protein (DUF486 family)